MPTVITEPVYRDPLIPVLKEGTPPSLTTDEQLSYIWAILQLCCSDSQFAMKAYKAILLVLAGSEAEVPPVVPSITTLTPNTIAVGGADFVLVVTGVGFSPTSVINIKGLAAPTTYVNEGEISTPIDMALVLVPTVAPITVSDTGGTSPAVDFTVTDVLPFVAQMKLPFDDVVKKPEVKSFKSDSKK